MGLILLLWVPLLVFSSGNPTYQIPAVTAFHVNLTLGTLPPATPPGGGAAALGFGMVGGAAGAVQFPLYRAGDRGAAAPWPGPGANGSSGGSALPPEYQPEQVQQLCVSPVRLSGAGLMGLGPASVSREGGSCCARVAGGGASACSACTECGYLHMRK